MFDPLLWFAMHGLKVAGVVAVSGVVYKTAPFIFCRYNPRKLMDITFKRSKLCITETKRNGDKYDIFPKLVSFENKDWGHEFKYRLTPGMSIEQFVEKKEFISSAFNGEAAVHGIGNELTIEIKRNTIPKLIYFDIKKIDSLITDMAIPVVIGYTHSGLEVIDFSKAPHGIIGGESGSGKSVFIRQLLATLALTKTPDEIEFTLIDLKHGVELSDFQPLPHVANFAEDINKVGGVLSEVNNLIDKRGPLFRHCGVKNIAQYNSKHPGYKIPYRLVVVDELAEIDDTDSIERISRLGRAYGVHMLLATQRPDRKVLEGQIKANSPLKICFQVINGVNSRIILDHEGAKNIPPIPGRCIVQYKGERQAQPFFLDEEKAQRLILRRINELSHYHKECEHHDQSVAGERHSDVKQYF